MKRLASLGGSVFLICLGVIAIIELVLVIVTKVPMDRSVYLSGLIFLIVFGVIYYFAFRLLGGWKTETWDGPYPGRQTLLFIMGLPGMILGSILLVILIALEIDFSLDSSSATGYSLSKKKKKVPGDPTTSGTGDQQRQQRS